MKDFKDFLSKLRPDHPRMFFNRDTWAEVERRSLAAAGQARAEMIARCRTLTDNPVCTGTEPAVTGFIDTPNGKLYIDPVHTPLDPINEFGYEAAECALAWRFTGEDIFLEKAKKMIFANIEGYLESYRNRRAVSWYSTTRIMTYCAYDWIYEALTDEERRAIIVPLVQNAEDVQARPGHPDIIRRDEGDYTTGFYGVGPLLWFSGLAAYGDGYCDELALANLKEGFENYRKLLDFREKVAGDDGGLTSGTPGYSLGAYPWAHFNFFHTVLSAAGENIAAEYPALALYPNWIYWIWMQNEYDIGKPVYSGFGDDTHESNELGLELVYQHMTQQIHFYKDVNPEAARLALSIRNLLPPGGELAPETYAGWWFLYPFIMDDDVSDVKAYTQEELSGNRLKARHFSGHGQIHMRSGFETDSTYAMFVAGSEAPSHKQMDENSFVIRKHDFLAIDSGTRAKQRDYNLRYYYHTTAAHNAMLIHKPGEPFPESWGPEYFGPEGKTNYGGQYPLSAKLLAYETNEAFTYIASDAAQCYGKKTPECIRQFVYLQPDYFIVYDRVTAEDPSYRKEWLLHTVHEPVIEGNLMRTDCGKGRLFCETLLPEGAEITLVGGPGKEYWANGKNWEVEKEYDDMARERSKKKGHDVYFGAWREEVSPAEPAEKDRFLHVLTAADTETMCPPETELLQDALRDGVRLTLPDGKQVTVYFNRDDEVGGEIIINGKAVTFTDEVQPQAGIGLEI